MTRGSDLLLAATRRLAAAGIEEPGRDARRLFAHAAAVPAGRLTLVLPEPVSEQRAALFEALVARRAAREPVSHLTGRRLFYGREFLVTPDVLDPRPETEVLVEAALAEPFARVLDLGTGSGCILLTLLAERQDAHGVGVELSGAACEVALRNRHALGLVSRADLVQGSWYAPLDVERERFDLIVSNPPYIARDEWETLAPEVRAHEPRRALTDEGDGLGCYRRIVAGAAAHLVAGGRLAVEIGPRQAAPVRGMMAEAGFGQIAVIPDLDGRDRVVQGRAAVAPARRRA